MALMVMHEFEQMREFALEVLGCEPMDIVSPRVI